MFPTQTRDIAVDADGSVFVTESISPTNASVPRAVIVLAYSTNGQPLWTNVLAGHNSVSENLGTSGSLVYVATTFQNQLLITAYSNQGTPVWTNKSPASSQGRIVVGSNDTVYVTGEAGYQYATVCYASSGEALWTNYYGVAIGSSYPTALVVGPGGNVFVTGVSYGDSTTLDDFATIAYTSSGSPLWTNRYNGPEDQNDFTRCVAVNNSGRVFVGGLTFGSNGGRNGDDDWIAIAYDGDGTGVWTNRFNGEASDNCLATAVAIDQNGTIFITGVAGEISSYDHVLTVALSSNAIPLWANAFSAAPGNHYQAVTVAVNSEGTVYLVAESKTVAYSSDGVPLWTNSYARFSPNSAKVDPDGNVVITGLIWSSDLVNNNYLTISYSPGGSLLWTNHYDGPSGDDIAYDLAIHTNGSVFVTGSSRTSASAEDYLTIAYSSLGVPLWTNRFTSSGITDDTASSIVVAKSGNVFVSGGSGQDFLTLAYSESGTLLWTNRFHKTGSVNSYYGPLLAVDENENVYVAGSVGGSASGLDYAVIAYSSLGVPLWTNSFDAGGNKEDTVAGLVADGRGHILVTGDSQLSGTDYDIVTIAYSTNGLPLWTNRYNGPANGPDGFVSTRCATLGPQGEIVVVGASNGEFAYQQLKEINYDFLAIKYVDLDTPKMLMPVQLPGNEWHVRLEGTPEMSYTIERSESAFGPWGVLGSTNVGANGVGVVPDQNPFPDTGFYRARYP